VVCAAGFGTLQQRDGLLLPAVQIASLNAASILNAVGCARKP
jgi:hypothetical protein